MKNSRLFELYVTSNQLIRFSSLHEMRDLVLGIDANYFVLKHLVSSVNRDNLFHLSSIPTFNLINALNEILDRLQNYGIKLLFVYDGLDTLAQSIQLREAFGLNNVEAMTNEWVNPNYWSSNMYPKNYSRQKEKEKRLFNYCLTYLKTVLRERNIDSFVAPYNALAQLAYFKRPEVGLIDAIYAGYDALLYNIPVFIVDLIADSISWLDQDVIVRHLILSENQLSDALILSGLSICPKFSAIENIAMMQGNLSFYSYSEACRYYQTGANLILSYEKDSRLTSNYLDYFCIAKCFYDYHIVMTTEGHLRPLLLNNIPKDLHNIFTTRLPDEIYFLISRSYVRVDTINTLLKGRYDNVDIQINSKYDFVSKNVESISTLLSQSLQFLTQPLQYFYQKKPVNFFSWSSPQVKIQISQRSGMARQDACNSWSITTEILSRNNIKEPDILSLLEDFTFYKKPNVRVTLGPIETIATSLLKLLYVRKFVTADLKVTKLGVAYINSLKVTSPETSQILKLPLFLFLDMLNCNVFEPFMENLEEDKDFTEDIIMDIFSLVFSFVPLVGQEIQKFRLSKPNRVTESILLAFHHFRLTYLDRFHDLYSNILLSLYLYSNSKKDLISLSEVQKKYPFMINFHLYPATYMKNLIIHVNSLKTMEGKKLMQGAVKQENAEFNTYHREDHEQLFLRCLEFWKAIKLGVLEAVKAGLVSNNYSRLFMQSDKLLCEISKATNF